MKFSNFIHRHPMNTKSNNNKYIAKSARVGTIVFRKKVLKQDGVVHDIKSQ